MATSITAEAMSARSDNAGAVAATGVHVPTVFARLHRCSGPAHAVSQQTPSAQNVEVHCAGSVQAEPSGRHPTPVQLLSSP